MILESDLGIEDEEEEEEGELLLEPAAQAARDAQMKGKASACYQAL